MLNRLIIIFIFFTVCLNAQQKIEKISLVSPKDWAGEVIKLPPSFAPTMEFKGSEDIRFSPGMFKPDSEYFFTYVFLLSGQYPNELNKESVEKEILIYYRGLAKAVGGKKFNLDPSTFSFEASSTDKNNFTGTLKWIEPFVTGKPQELHLDITVWDTREKQFLFAMASPAQKTTGVWKALEDIKKTLSISYQK
jgi:hypothetical protein